MFHIFKNDRIKYNDVCAIYTNTMHAAIRVLVSLA